MRVNRAVIRSLPRRCSMNSPKLYFAAGQSGNQTIALTRRSQVLRQAAASAETAIGKLHSPAPLAAKDQTSLRLAVERGAQASQELQNYPKSADLWKKAADIYQRAGMVNEQIGCLRSLAAVLDLQKRPLESLEARRTSVTLAMAADQSQLTADIIKDMIQAFTAAGDLPNALEACRELSFVVEKSGNMQEVAWVVETRGSLLAGHAQYEDAIGDLDYARKKYLTEVGDIWAASRVALELAAAQNAVGRTADAQETLESAIEEIETKFGFESYNLEEDMNRNRTTTDLYCQLVGLYVRNHLEDKAADLVRKAKHYTWFPSLLNQLRDDTDVTVSQFAGKIDILKQEPDVPLAPGTNRIVADTMAGCAEWCWRLEQDYPPQVQGAAGRSTLSTEKAEQASGGYGGYRVYADEILRVRICVLRGKGYLPRDQRSIGLDRLACQHAATDPQ